ncbi:MAG: hypothetical protein DMG65_17395, partial [Candidatus Angelobacter sp. Gp1-AA117]
ALRGTRSEGTHDTHGGIGIFRAESTTKALTAEGAEDAEGTRSKGAPRRHRDTEEATERS